MGHGSDAQDEPSGPLLVAEAIGLAVAFAGWCIGDGWGAVLGSPEPPSR